MPSRLKRLEGLVSTGGLEMELRNERAGLDPGPPES
jgi:hypothetical protein